MTRTIRPSALAGHWYPAHPRELRDSMAGFLDSARNRPLPGGRPIVVVAPHAGHAWSGEIAGEALGHLADQRYDRIVLLAPNHRQALRAASAPGEDAYATPLGDVALDAEGRDGLLCADVIVCDPDAHRHEHAEEIQLPFLQVLWPQMPPVLPLLVPPLARESRSRLATALGRWCDGRTLFLVSTDFTHYGRAFGYLPFEQDIPQRLEALDMGAVEFIKEWDAPGLRRYATDTGMTMCGLEAMLLVMSLPWPRPPLMVQTGYGRSAQRDGDHSRSVSYVGMVGVLPHGDTP